MLPVIHWELKVRVTSVHLGNRSPYSSVIENRIDSLQPINVSTDTSSPRSAYLHYITLHFTYWQYTICSHVNETIIRIWESRIRNCWMDFLISVFFFSTEPCMAPPNFFPSKKIEEKRLAYDIDDFLMRCNDKQWKYCIG